MSKLLTWCIFKVLVLQSQCASFNTPVLQIPQGKLMGLETNRSYLRQYLGIPYGTVDERFQEAGPPPRWLGVFNASDTSSACAQYHERLGLPTGVEDCLTLNVYTPGQVSYKRLYPVMVFIHGGGYKTGSNTNYLYNPQLLVQKGVIVVTVNYRLGAFGFLCLRIQGAPGNIGLKDQVAALRWVKQNIRTFGGNPDSVTIFGESAGSASVSYLIMSPAAKGLFSGAIMESASSLSPFAFSNDPIERASLVASKMGYNTKNPFEILRIFRNATKNEILMASATNTSVNLWSKYVFRPCVEKQMASSKPFLTMSPQEILESGTYNKVSMIIGYNDKEGILYVKHFNKQLYKKLNDNFSDMLPDNLYFSDSREKTKLASKVKTFYFGNRTINEDSVDSLIDYITDVMFHYPSVSITEYFLKNNHLPIFNYYFKYDSFRNLAKILLGKKGQKGAAHGDELFYLFQPVIFWPLPLVGNDKKVVERMTSMWTNFAKFGNLAKILLGKKGQKGAAHGDELFYLFQPVIFWPLPLVGNDKKVVERMTSMWTNFAKFGNPTSLKSPVLNINWNASDETSLRYLTIDKSLSVDSLPNPERIDFWRNIYKTRKV